MVSKKWMFRLNKTITGFLKSSKPSELRKDEDTVAHPRLAHPRFFVEFLLSKQHFCINGLYFAVLKSKIGK